MGPEKQTEKEKEKSKKPAKTSTKWGLEFDTVRRENLFRHPPTDRSAYPALDRAIRPHIDSFNAIFGNQKLIDLGLQDIGTRVFAEPDEIVNRRMTANTGGNDDDSDGGAQPARPVKRARLSTRIAEVILDRPMLPASNKHVLNNRQIYPAECRERHATYRGRLRARLQYRVDDGEWHEITHELGNMPIMLRTNRCHLEGLKPASLVHAKEESDELGGYFIVNGNEKLIRMLIVGKRNYPQAIVRGSYTGRGGNYSKFGVQIRSVRPDQTSQSITLHYLTDGNVTFRFSWKKNEYLVPVVMILKALVETNDRAIFEALVGKQGSEGAKNTFVTERAEYLLRAYKAYKLYGKAKTRAYLGEKFKPVLDIPSDSTDEEAGTEFLRKVVLVHLGNVNVTEAQDLDKFNMILFMIRKLYALAAGDCTSDNPDAQSNQEILMGGFLYGMIVKEKLEDWLMSIRYAIREWSSRYNHRYSFTDPMFMKEFSTKILKRTSDQIGNAMEYFLSTGNLTSGSGLDLQQTSGFTVVAEKINFTRFLSHFRMIHRGAFFAQLKTTTVRKLLPEGWGFLCPVHTPDGSPCGLLNHLAHKCEVTTKDSDVSSLIPLLRQLGTTAAPSASVEESISVQLDGKVVGYCSPKDGQVICDNLRYWKVNEEHNIPLDLEIGYVPLSNGGLYPGVYLFSQSARMVRAVKYLPLNKIDKVGPFEQQYMSIACQPHEIESGVSTHVEEDVKNILSIFANQTPFSDHNQSPRNMYQCQMSKQTMGTFGTAIQYRTDNKAYRLQSGQTPIVRAKLYNEYGLDNFPNGTNAVVAVISYTGYDMDDAMILNKFSHERGFGHGTVYKTKIVKLDEKGMHMRGRTSIKELFGFAPNSMISSHARNTLDDDGLPRIGAMLKEGDVYCASHEVHYDPVSNGYLNTDGKTHFHKYKDTEIAYIDDVRIIGSETGDVPCQAVSIKLRIPRSPVIGDKFSSRHGQKGVCSQKFPTQDMPFSESGMVPDVIINPHAFPSRMTIGMFIESLAGKSGALHGFPQDSSPWRFNEDNMAGKFFGEQLVAAGYNYFGNEPMYSGITGEEFAADIYLGLVYYQRLRHMVNDKFQVRTTGPVNSLTGQPIKGRSKGGGIRVGEMERDALLAHGAAFLLQDRLLNCSDYTRSWICKACGSFLSVQTSVPAGMNSKSKNPARDRVYAGRTQGVVRCRVCAKRATANTPSSLVWEDGDGIKFEGGDQTTVVAVPGVLKYLDVELAAMGIKLKFRVRP